MTAKEILVKKYVVRSSVDEREQLAALILKGSNPAHRLPKARIMFKNAFGIVANSPVAQRLSVHAA